MRKQVCAIQISSNNQASDWRKIPDVAETEVPRTLFLKRFQDHSAARVERMSAPKERYYTLCVNKLRGRLDCTVNGRMIFSGHTQPGFVHLVQPSDATRLTQYSPVDVYHMFIPSVMVRAVAEENGLGGSAVRQDLIHEVDFRPNTKLFELVTMLSQASSRTDAITSLYTEGLSQAILAVLLGSYSTQTPKISGFPEAKRYGLTGWQLRRIEDFVDAHMSEPITLQTLAGVLGLSRMHFAAQFRRATGLRPHEHLLQMRIDRAKQLLRDSSLPILEIASSVGFETQAHFSTVFKRLVDETPARWRLDNRASSATAALRVKTQTRVDAPH